MHISALLISSPAVVEEFQAVSCWRDNPNALAPPYGELILYENEYPIARLGRVYHLARLPQEVRELTEAEQQAPEVELKNRCPEVRYPQFFQVTLRDGRRFHTSGRGGDNFTRWITCSDDD